jgi:hypothetical protein
MSTPLFSFLFFSFLFFFFFFFFLGQLLSINPTDSTSLTLADKIISLLPISKVATKNNISQGQGQGPINSVVMVDMQINNNNKKNL